MANDVFPTSKFTHLCRKDLDGKRGYTKFTENVLAASAFLKILRDEEHLRYAENLTYVDDFMLLYDATKSKDIYAHWKYEYFDIRPFGGHICHLVIGKSFDFLKHFFIIFLTY